MNKHLTAQAVSRALGIKPKWRTIADEPVSTVILDNKDQAIEIKPVELNLRSPSGKRLKRFRISVDRQWDSLEVSEMRAAIYKRTESHLKHPVLKESRSHENYMDDDRFLDIMRKSMTRRSK